MMYCYGRRRCRALAAGTGRHAAEGGRGSAAAAGRRAAAVHRQAEILTRFYDESNCTHRRHHHERRHRTHGHESAPAALDLRHHAAGRRAAQRERIHHARSRCWSAAMPPSWRRSRRNAADCEWTTDLDKALDDPQYSIYFDAQTTDRRADAVKAAIARGKHIYCEKPTADNSGRRATSCTRLAKKAGVKHGVVQDKLWLPGMLKLKTLSDTGFFGEILSVRGEFGYWVFEGDTVPAQRPSWNYRKEDGGGIIIDMLCHWRYVLDNLFGEVKAVSCLGATHIKQRWNEAGKPYDVHRRRLRLRHLRTGERRDRALQLLLVRARAARRSADAAGGRHAGIGGRGPARLLDPAVRRDAASDVESRCRQPVQVLRRLAEGARAGDLRQRLQAPVGAVPAHVVKDGQFPWDLLEGAKGVQLAEKGIESWQKRCWVDVPKLNA